MQKKLVLKDKTLTECLVVSSHVPTLKQQVKQRHITLEMAVCLFPEAAKKKPFLGFKFFCYSIGT